MDSELTWPSASTAYWKCMKLTAAESCPSKRWMAILILFHMEAKTGMTNHPGQGSGSTVSSLGIRRAVTTASFCLVTITTWDVIGKSAHGVMSN
jgi:hypothetical protein